MGLRYESEFKRIWTDHVPQAGQSDTVEGELVRSIEKLANEALRNGNINWDRGHRRLLDYIQPRLLDPQVFPPHMIEQTAAVIDLISDPQTPRMEPELYDELLDRAVEYFLHYGSQPHERDPELKR